MNRFDRIIAILIQLQTRRVVKAQDLAERFDVSLRTIYRDIRSLEEAGVPIHGEAGMGYSLLGGYRLPPVMFTREEATAIVAAEKLMEGLGDEVVRKNYASFAFKVRSVLRTDEKDMVEKLDDHIHVEPLHSTPNSANNALDNLMKAIADKRSVRMKYYAISNDEITERIIDPIGIYSEYQQWYTVGYCHLRHDYRSFRLERIQEIILIDQSRKKDLITLEEYRKKKKHDRLQIALEKVVIRLEKSVVRYLGNFKHQMGYLKEDEVEEGYIDVTFLTSSDFNGLSRWYLMFADQAQILQPERLKKEVNTMIENLYQQRNN